MIVKLSMIPQLNEMMREIIGCISFYTYSSIMKRHSSICIPVQTRFIDLFQLREGYISLI